MFPATDIIITTRNNASVLRENLTSVAKQTFTNYRCYVVDDCSTDETAAMLADEFPWVNIVRSRVRRGPSFNRNLAIARGDAPFIVTLDDDVKLVSNWLEEMVNFISFSPAIGSAGSQLRFSNHTNVINGIGGCFNDNGLGRDIFFNKSSDEVKKEIKDIRRIIYACSAAMILRRSVFEKVGGFDPIYFYLAEDFDLGLRINAAGYIVLYNPKAIAYHHYNETVKTFSSQKLQYLYYRNCLYTILKNFSGQHLKNILRILIQERSKKQLLFIRIVAWNIWHLHRIKKWKKSIQAYRNVDEKQIIAINENSTSLEAGKSNPRKKQAARQSWKTRLLKMVFYLYNLQDRKIRKAACLNKHVDNIIFLVTNMCNAKCKQCFVSQQLNKEVDKNLTVTEIDSFFASLGKVNNIVLGGGEPFLRDDLDKICMVLERRSQPRCITIPTNGFSPKVISEKVKVILESTHKIIKISLSIDGPQKLHDEIRGVPGLFDKVQETYQELSLLHSMFYPRLSLQVNSTIFQDNYQEFFKTYHIVKKEFPLADFTFEVIRGHYDSNKTKPISDCQYKELIDSLRDIGDEENKKSIALHEYALEVIAKKEQVIACNAGRNFIVLDFWGNLSPCESLPAFINIRDINYDFTQIADDPRWHAVVEDIKKGKCYCTHMCFLASSFYEMTAQSPR
jgi:GT2 family glycosyltransferase/MoaA/NifB/PqqE/SkfB family radical SAM enzyme